MNTHPVFEALRNSPDACVCSVLRKAARTSTRMYDGVLAPSGLTIAQVSVLAALYYTRSIPMKKLARRLVMERTTLTRNLAPLERRNFIELVEDRDDRRIRMVNLTAQGLEALISALPYWQKAQDKMIAGLGESRWQELRSSLRLSVDIAITTDQARAGAEATME